MISPLYVTYKVLPLSMDNFIYGSIYNLCLANLKPPKSLFYFLITFVAFSHIIGPSQL